MTFDNIAGANMSGISGGFLCVVSGKLGRLSAASVSISSSSRISFFFGVLLTGAALQSSAAQAADCGVAVPLPAAVTCASIGNSYPTGISFDAGSAEFTLTIDEAVTIERAQGAGNLGIDLYGNGANDLTLILEDGAKINTQGLMADGARVRLGGDGNVNITSGADISIDRDFHVTPVPPDVSIVSDPTSALLGWITSKTSFGAINIVQQHGSKLTLAGAEELNGLYAIHEGRGNVTLSSDGEIYGNSSGDPVGLLGTITNAGSIGGISAFQGTRGVIHLTGQQGAGLYGLNHGLGNTVTGAAGQILINGNLNDAVISFSMNPDAIGVVSSTVASSGRVFVTGNNSAGARSLNFGQGETQTSIFGSISVLGDVSHGARLQQFNTLNTASQSVTVGENGRIVTDGFSSHGVRAVTDGGNTMVVDVRDSAKILTQGEASDGVAADAAHAAGAIELGVTSAASVTTRGSKSAGARLSAGGAVTLTNEGQIISSGEYGVGIAVTSANAAANVTIGSNGVVAGGWQNGLAPALGATLPSAGVIFDTGLHSLLLNQGIIGAGSDRAVVDLIASTGDIDISNSGRITGFLEFAGSGAHAFTNEGGGIFDVRHFADTDGDGVRDTKRVSISDFGASGGAFTNTANALVQLAPVLGETTVDPLDYYIPSTGLSPRPLEASNYALSRSGIVQGQFLNLDTFSNAGLIDLRGSAIGNTLVMTDQSAAGTAVPGSGTFRAEGGTLLLNTFFNEGIPVGGDTGSLSDVLVVDTTELGAAPTGITIARRQGPGAATPGNGILVVEVRNKGVGASAADVFALNGDFVADGQQQVVGGAHRYGLFQNGVVGDVADGNWYLRNLGLSPIVPIYEEYPKVLLPLVELPTLQQRVGNRQWKQPAAPRTPQTVFCKDPAQNYQCVVTDVQASYYLDEAGSVVTETAGIWGRIEGGYGHYAPTTTVGSQYNSTIWGLQAGVDTLISESEDGKLIGGVTLNYGRTSANITAPGSAGNITSSAYGLGGTLTWYGASGLYADGQVQLSWLDSQLSSLTTGRSLIDGNKGFGYAFSLEAGQHIALDNHWTVTPQAQLKYASVGFDSFTDVFGTQVALLQGQSLRGRLGVAAEYQSSWKAEDGTVSRLSAHGIVNLEQELLDGTRVSVSGYEFASRDNGLWGGVGLGSTYNWNDDKYSIYGEVSASTGLERFGDSFELGGTIGLRVKW